MRIFSLLLTFALVSCEGFQILPPAAEIHKCDRPVNSSSQGFQNGNGLSVSTPFEICTAAQLNLIGNDSNLTNKHYSILKNINMSGITFNMIASSGGGEFSGSINGNNFTISNLSISEPTLDFIGFIRSNVGAISNLHFNNIDISGNSYVGGIVGENFGDLTNVSVTGNILGHGYALGGITGYSLGTIQKSFVKNIFAGGWDGAALFTGVNEGTISNSYAIGKLDCSIVACNGDNYGGFVGYQDDGAITNCYAVADLNDVTPTLGYGFADVDGGVVAGSFWDEDVYTTSEVSGGTASSTAQMKTQVHYTGWDFTSIWKIDPANNSGYPELR